MMPGHTDHDNRLPVSLPFWTVLSLGVGLLVLLAVTTVLGIQLWMSQGNTTRLLNDKAKLTIERIEAEFRRHLQPAVDQTALIQRLLEDGVYVDEASGKTVFSYAHPIFWAPFTPIGDGGGARPST